MNDKYPQSNNQQCFIECIHEAQYYPKDTPGNEAKKSHFCGCKITNSVMIVITHNSTYLKYQNQLLQETLLSGYCYKSEHKLQGFDELLFLTLRHPVQHVQL